MASLTYEFGVQEFSQDVEAENGARADHEEEHSEGPIIQHTVDGIYPRAFRKERIQAPAN